MASMSKKEYELLQDAVNEGIEAFLLDPIIAQANYPTNSPLVQRILRKNIAHYLADRLKYTSDNFDRIKFIREITEASVKPPIPEPV